MSILRTLMDHAAWSSVWKTGGFLAVCCRITGASSLEYIFARKCPLPSDAGHMTIRTGLDMAAKRGSATLHEGVGGSAHVSGQGMALLIGRKGVLEDRLQRDERHRGLRTSGLRASLGCFAQYHANYPRCKRLVQTGVIGNVPVDAG